jgi:hypothetical protein
MLKITFENDRRTYIPGEKIVGQVAWDALPSRTDALELRLIWFTRGKGDRDVDIVADSKIGLTDQDLVKGVRPFEFAVPNRPFSFSGALIELTWAVEAVVLPDRDSTIENIAISSSGESIVLDKKYEDALSSRFVFRTKAGK